MSSIDIILLGILSERPRNAYEINKTIERRKVRSWLNVSEAAVYRNLRKLSAGCHLDTHKEKTGLMPEKTIYTVTKKGHAHFLALIANASHVDLSLGFEFDTWVSHLDHLPPKEGRERLEALQNQFANEYQSMKTLRENYGEFMPPGAVALISLRIQFLETAAKWANDLANNWESILGDSKSSFK